MTRTTPWARTPAEPASTGPAQTDAQVGGPPDQHRIADGSAAASMTTVGSGRASGCHQEVLLDAAGRRRRERRPATLRPLAGVSRAAAPAARPDFPPSRTRSGSRARAFQQLHRAADSGSARVAASGSPPPSAPAARSVPHREPAPRSPGRPDRRPATKPSNPQAPVARPGDQPLLVIDYAPAAITRATADTSLSTASPTRKRSGCCGPAGQPERDPQRSAAALAGAGAAQHRRTADAAREPELHLRPHPVTRASACAYGLLQQRGLRPRLAAASPRRCPRPARACCSSFVQHCALAAPPVQRRQLPGSGRVIDPGVPARGRPERPAPRCGAGRRCRRSAPAPQELMQSRVQAPPRTAGPLLARRDTRTPFPTTYSNDADFPTCQGYVTAR